MAGAFSHSPTEPFTALSTHAQAGMDIDDTTLAALLSSRICHDLVGPVGALNNGIEIIEDGADADLKDHALKLIGTSARQAAARLQFFRAAFGAGSGFSDDMQVDGLRELSEAFVEGGRVVLEWTPGEATLDRVKVRLLLNLLLIGIESLPRGGRIRTGAMGKSDGVHLIVMAEGRNAMLSERTRRILRLGQFDDALEPREAALLLTHRLAAKCGAELTFGQEDDKIVIAATV